MKVLKERYNVILNPEVKSAAAQLAAQKDISFSQLVEKALRREVRKSGLLKPTEVRS